MDTRRSAALFASLAILLLLAGCGRATYPARPRPAALPPGSPLASPTLDPRDAWLRHYLMAGEPESAAAQLRDPRSAPRDDLLRNLQLGLVLREAERWSESNDAFQAAETEAELRFARSATQELGSLLVNDAVVAYTPPPAELAMIPFYRMLNYLALGQRDEAWVEARKATAYLERLRTSAGEPCVGEGLVQYLAGLTFAAAGDRADALVALRQAERAYDACREDGVAPPPSLGEDLYRAALASGVREVADSAAVRYRLAPPAFEPEMGEVLVVVEEGWVAHRAGDALHVPIWDRDVDGLRSDDRDGIAASAGRVTARVLESAVERARWGSSAGDHPVVQVAAALDGAYVMRLAWPVFQREAASPAAVRLRVDDAPLEAAAPASDLSALLVRRWERQRPAALARMVGRGMAKYLVSREAERGAERNGGEAAGWLVGRLSNLAGNRLERADTRSWSLLPDRVALLRLALPPGEHRLSLEIEAEDGSVTRSLDLGRVRVEAGRATTLARRVWGMEVVPLLASTPR
jgi:uncharacterized protein